MSLSKLNYLVLVLIGFYFLLSIIKIEHPGVNNDQLMFVNTATLNPDNFFLWKSFHKIPVMVFPYIGALKSYLYMPVFYLFGVNIWSIRLPQIILICITWFILYKALNLAFNKKLALVTILFLSLDPSIIAYSKIDQGPTVLEFFFKVLTIYLFFLFTKTKKRIFFLAIFLSLALGIFNKLNFIWFVNAFLVSIVIFYRTNIYVLVVPYLLLLKLFLRISKEVSLSYKDFADPVALSNVFGNLSVFFNNLINIVNGNIPFRTVYGYDPTQIGIFFSMFVFFILFTGICHKSKSYGFFLSIIIITVFQLLLTKKAISPWHALAIYPFFTIIFAFSVLQFKRIAILLIVAIVFYEIFINFIYLNKYSQPTQAVAYSSKIYDLIDFAKATKAKFICLDVDICNQLLSFTQQKDKYKEPFFYLDPPTYNYSFIKLAGNFNYPDDYLYLAHGDLKSHFPDLKKQFFKYLQDSKINYVKIEEFKDGDSIAFEIYKVGI